MFSAHDTPAPLRGAHSTRAGVWGRLIVLEGSLTFVDERPGGSTLELGPGKHDVIEPEAAHRVDPSPGCRFRVAFMRAADP